MVNIQYLDYSIGRFVIILLVTWIIIYLATRRFKGENKFVIYVISLFLFVYSGIGGSFIEVPIIYIFYYFIFLIFFLIVFIRIGFKNTKTIKYQIFVDNFISKEILSRRNANIIILTYFTVVFVSSYYPDFNFKRLFIILNPELKFSIERFHGDSIQSLLFYIELLLRPLYFLSLIQYRKRLIRFILILIIPLYIGYTASPYISRSDLVPLSLVFLYSCYYYYPIYRKTIILLLIASIGPMIIMLYRYSMARIGAEFQNTSLIDALVGILNTEITFPLHFKEFWNNEFRQDIDQFVLWIITLPIPGFIKGSAFGFSLNYNTSAFLLNVEKGGTGYYVLLIGMVTESFIIFGKYFIFLMAILCGYVLGYTYRILSFSSQFNILRFYFIFYICYAFARAGTGALFPTVINSFILFYIVVIYIYNKVNKCYQYPSLIDSSFGVKN